MSEASDIISEFRVNDSRIDAVAFIPPKPKRIILSFTGMDYGKYDRWSWFYGRHMKHSNTDAFVSFKDDRHLFYLDVGEDRVAHRHREFISEFVDKHGLTMADVHAVGGSMGGYAAIYFAMTMGFGSATTSVPLATKQAAEQNPLTLWTRKMKECGDDWQELPSVIDGNSHNSPRIFISHGSFAADVMAANDIESALVANKKSYGKECLYSVSTHENTLSQGDVFSIIDRLL